MMEQTKIYKALKRRARAQAGGSCGARSPHGALQCAVAEQRWIKEIDINPLLASPDGLIALDARVVVHGPEVTLDQVPKTAIRAYPTRYVAPWTMKDGNAVTIRPIRPEDEPALVRFHETLSERTVYLRYST